MSICVRESPAASSIPRALAATRRAAAGLVQHHTLGRLRHLLTTWRARQRDRGDLRRLPDYLLRDIGLDVDETRQESRKTFWQT
ncbi:DUF1127 domain-containing protein [Pelagibius marinus]|uniref:DUF1127 domain-containing protein n=1 Tax=Pelagibius marinus TaxID=2762760 RepID=UPI001D03BB0F|nr:DUF1127 domain-containing protein [Pelagibius marinus]